jgi:histidinol dehydrogenase
MKLVHHAELDASALAALLGRASGGVAEAIETVRPILAAVRERGDDAVLELSRRFDRVEPSPLLLGEREIAQRALQAGDELKAALRSAASAIEAVHAAQRRSEPATEPVPGVHVWRESRPIESVGLYVPGGSAPLPSTALMLAVPAAVAGCRRRVLCTPPGPDGGPSPAVCAAALVAGVQELYCAGGAQAIAALAFGTQALGAPVDKIFGPGNRYVAAAKQLVSVEPGGPTIDLLAGPSEVLVLADADAEPAWVAADLLAQAEHDADAIVTLVSDSERLLAAVEDQIEDQLATLPRAATARQALERHGVAILVPDLWTGVQLANRLAPEHLSLHVADARRWAALVQSAGAVFVGPMVPEAAGDYATGANHTLPTCRAARHSGGLSLDAFQRWVTFQQFEAAGLGLLAPTISVLARAEGLEAHARSVEMRLR